MELLEALRIIRNQVKLVIPLTILAFIAAGFMVTQMETTYETRGTVTLLNSNAQSTDNPYLRFDQSLQTTAQVLGDTVSSADSKSAFAKKKFSTNYEISVPFDPTRSTLLPMLEVKVNASSPQIASSTRDAILNEIKDELSRKQTEAGAPKDTWIQVFAKADREVIPVSGSKARTFIIVFGLGTAFAIACAFVVDGFKRGVKNTRRGETIVLENSKTADSNLKETTSASKASGRVRTKRTPKSSKLSESNSDSVSDTSITV